MLLWELERFNLWFFGFLKLCLWFMRILFFFSESVSAVLFING